MTRTWYGPRSLDCAGSGMGVVLTTKAAGVLIKLFARTLEWPTIHQKMWARIPSMLRMGAKNW